jgi:uncharacterized protein YidB (DUF937 family)
MALFTSLVEMVLSGFGDSNSTQAKLAQAVLGRIKASNGGGLTELVRQLESQGLGHVVQSWVGTGANKAITAEQLESALGSDWMQKLSAHLGVPPEVISQHLSEILPKIVDRLTPDGKLPEAAPAT